MKFIANGLNRSYLANVLPSPLHEVGEVYAAIAYGSHSNNDKDDFISNCLNNGSRLDIWMRYDHTVPVSVPLMRRILSHYRDNIFCNLIPDCLHSKVIWWKGYGAYIGSANLTDRAWMTNIEAGVFMTDADLQESGMDLGLEDFFEALAQLKEGFPLSEEVIQELEAIDKARRGIEDTGINLRKIPVWAGPQFIESKNLIDRRKEGFRKEWHETLTTLRSIGELLKTHRPSWITAGTPLNWQVDQFLHAYYYNRVGDRNRKPYQEYFARNRGNPKGAVSGALGWWQATTAAPSDEDNNLFVRAPKLQELLSKTRILSLSEAEFATVCAYTHATTDHVAKMELGQLGRPDLQHLSIDERVPLFSKWLLGKKNKKGWTVLQLLKYVLYEGQDADLWDRLYTAARDPDYSLSHYGLNSMAELVGWARPELAPPRNGRTSKALRALGYDVRIY